jgi:SAM-dependent methyltransferase
MPSSNRISASRRAAQMSDRAARPHVCPSCGAPAERPFYEVDRFPVHQVKLVPTRAQALNCARGDIRMCFCASCGFVWNRAFDPARMRYEDDYESTQAASPTFNAFHERLARDLIERFDLHGKRVVELGCGQGEFITMLAELGGNEGYGFDRVIRHPGTTGKVTLIKDLYADPYRGLAPDFVCSKMTLEHVHDVATFLRSLRRTIGDRPESVIVFMIPELTRILNLRAFWDIYYEHCSYFSPGSLARLFRSCGFEVLAVELDYDDQYILLEARVGSGEPLPQEEPVERIARDVEEFERRCAEVLAGWRERLAAQRRDGRRVALWGSGSKAVSFLTTLAVADEVETVVDINPRKHGKFMPGTGHEVFAPEDLRARPPDLVIAMNPVYLEEIGAMLSSFGLSPELTAL